MQSNYQIRVDKQKENEDKFIFSVNLKVENSSKHIVTVDKNYYKKITDKKESAEDLIKRSFEFLLEKEPQGAILSEFNLKAIKDYFPEYESKI